MRIIVSFLLLHIRLLIQMLKPFKRNHSLPLVLIYTVNVTAGAIAVLAEPVVSIHACLVVTRVTTSTIRLIGRAGPRYDLAVRGVTVVAGQVAPMVTGIGSGRVCKAYLCPSIRIVATIALN